MVQETLFLSLLHTEWCRKRCFFHYSIRNGAGNVVSFFAPYGMVQETLFFSLFHTEWCRKRCFFHYSIRNGAGNVVSNSTPVESAEALSPYLNLLRNLSMLFLLTRNFLTFPDSRIPHRLERLLQHPSCQYFSSRKIQAMNRYL